MTDEYGVRHPGRREAAIAVAVACLLVLVSWLASHNADDPNPSGDLTALASSPKDSIVEIDLPGDVTPQQGTACLPDATVLYSSLQKTATGSTPVLVMRDASGDLRLCDSFGSDSPSVAPVKLADDRHQVRLLSNGRQSWDCDGRRLAGFRVSHWLSVGPEVDRVDLRFVIDGSKSPWFSSVAAGGFVHAHAWISEQNDGAQVQVQARVLDAEGSAVRQSALPTAPRPITGCNGTDMQLG